MRKCSKVCVTTEFEECENNSPVLLMRSVIYSFKYIMFHEFKNVHLIIVAPFTTVFDIFVCKVTCH